MPHPSPPRSNFIKNKTKIQGEKKKKEKIYNTSPPHTTLRTLPYKLCPAFHGYYLGEKIN